MKRLIKAVCTFLLVLSTGLTGLSLYGCSNRRGGGEVIDTSRTQIYVAVFNGGYGSEWLQNAKVRFEETFKDKSYESGKKGAQIIITPYLDRSICSTSLYNNIDLNPNEMFFTETIPYQEFVSGGKFLDITEAVTTPLTEFGEEKSIEDKMFPYHIENFKTDGKYYALPYYEAFHGIIYDVDMFEDELFYFALDQDNDNDGFIFDLEDERSYGPDGRTGVIDGVDYSVDDGLPATYEEFYRLCDRMKEQGIDPITWSGGNPSEVTKTMSALHADYEGADQMMLNLTFDGTATGLVDTVDENGNITLQDPLEITEENGYMLQRQAGKYYALDFFDTIIEREYYADLTFNTSQSNTGAQEEYLYSKFSSSKTPIAMLVDGSYWENEASGIFTDMVNGGYGQAAAKENRRFALMPYPKATQEKLEEQTSPVFMDINYSTALVSSRIEEFKIPLALDLLRFLHTDKELCEYTVTTNTPKPYQYDLGEEYLSRMTYYGRSLYELHSSGNIIYPSSNSPVFYRNFNNLTPEVRPWVSTIGTSTYNVPITGLRASGVDAKDYFDGLMNARGETYWRNNILVNL